MVSVLLSLLLWAAGTALAQEPPAQERAAQRRAAQSDTVAAPEVSRFVIFRAHLPPGQSGPQASMPHGRYMVNFGSRNGVKRGSIFRVQRATEHVGLVRVERV